MNVDFPSQVGSNSSGFLRNNYSDYLIVAFVAILLASVVGKLGDHNLEKNRPPFAPPRDLAILIWAFALAFLAMGVYRGASCVDPARATTINILFFLQIIFFIAWTVVYQRFNDYVNTLWSGFILIVLGLATIFFLWQVRNIQAIILVLIYLVWVGYEVFNSWHIMKRCAQNNS